MEVRRPWPTSPKRCRSATAIDRVRHHRGLMRARLAVTPDQFRKLTYVTLAALALIVMTGAAVRLSDSGLGCPTWPRCYGHVYPPVALHPLIEFGNRALSGLVGV